MSIAYFISPHGFGHAARAASIISAVGALNASAHFHIFTKVPEWFFRDSCTCSFTYHEQLTDIGLVQDSALHENLSQTIVRLDQFLPFDSAEMSRLGEELRALGCSLIVCDVAPMGIAVAQAAGIPSVLIENFTWDWIYEGYVAQDARIKPHADYLRTLFRSADYHIGTEPICESWDADLITTPISRPVRNSREDVRRQLELSSTDKMVMLTMGGTEEKYSFIEELFRCPEIHFVIPGGAAKTEVRKNVILLPFHSEFFHPDLVNASDGVVGKLGYSTLAEVYHAGVPFGYLAREKFRESAEMEKFVKKEMQALHITEQSFRDGSFTAAVKELVALPRIQRSITNGAVQAAEFLVELLG